MTQEPAERPRGQPPQQPSPEDYAQAVEWFSVDVPEFYADTVNVSLAPFGVSLGFGIRSPRGPRPNARLHMSHQMALVLERLLRRVIMTYEAERGRAVYVEREILEQLGVTDDALRALEERRPAEADGTGG
jgi:hypothetical protein